MKEEISPYQCHIFVCVNDRAGARKSCADGENAALRNFLKNKVKDRGWSGRVRVSGSGCLGLCAKGPNVILYPQKVLFSNVSADDAEDILEKVAEFLE